MGAKLILVCRDGEASQAYLNEAKKIGAEVDVVSTYGELFNAMIETSYQGVMADLVTSMEASKEEKGMAQEIIEVFPIIQLKWDNESKTIRTISLSKLLNSDSLADFVTAECEVFTPRAIRLNVRKSIHFNTIICREEKMTDKNIEKTVTINASKVVVSCFPYKTGHGFYRSGLSSMNCRTKHYFRRYTLKYGIGQNHDDTGHLYKF